MNLSQISDALQRGESLTNAMELHVFRAVHPNNQASFVLFCESFGHPFRSLEAALAFVEEVFPGCEYLIGNKFRDTERPWGRIQWVPPGSDDLVDEWRHAPTPAAAIRAAAIEAFLAKGGR